MFLCSLGISSSLRLTIYSSTMYDGRIQFGMAFTPHDVPTDPNLYDKLRIISSEPDIWMHTPYSKEPLEAIISNGKLLARGHMTPGPFSVINIATAEVRDTEQTEAVALPIPPKMKPLDDEESIRATLASRNLRGLSLGKITCIIEIGNCLNSTLRNPSGFFCNNTHNNSLPSEILPFHREKFRTFADTTLEGMFSYEIESTDLCLLVALRAQADNNSFAVAFTQLAVRLNKNELMAQVDPTAWKTHQYKKHAHAKDGEQVIEIRNIRASVKMTEDTESLLKIRLFAFE